MPIPVVNAVAAVPKPAPNAGTGLFATTTIGSGMNVCSLPTSLVAVLDTSRLADTCSNCFGTKSCLAQEITTKREVQLKTCSGCHVVKYCDKVSSICGYLLVQARSSMQDASLAICSTCSVSITQFTSIRTSLVWACTAPAEFNIFAS